MASKRSKTEWERVKGWACFSYGDVCALSVKSGPYKLPCYILVRKQDLEGRNGK